MRLGIKPNDTEINYFTKRLQQDGIFNTTAVIKSAVDRFNSTISFNNVQENYRLNKLLLCLTPENYAALETLYLFLIYGYPLPANCNFAPYPSFSLVGRQPLPNIPQFVPQTYFTRPDITDYERQIRPDLLNIQPIQPIQTYSTKT